MLCVARGKVSEGIDFDHHYGRTVLCIGKSSNSLALTVNNYVHRSPLPIHLIPDPKSPPRIPPRKLPHPRKRLPLFRRDAPRSTMSRPCPPWEE